MPGTGWQTITWDNVDPNLCRYMASWGHKQLAYLQLLFSPDIWPLGSIMGCLVRNVSLHDPTGIANAVYNSPCTPKAASSMPFSLLSKLIRSHHVMGIAIEVAMVTEDPASHHKGERYLMYWNTP